MVTSHILIVDDDCNDLELYRLAFLKAGCLVPLHLIEGGKAAIEYLAGRGIYADRNRFPIPSILVLDLKMPEVSGFDVLSFLRSAEQEVKIPAVVCSASASERDIRQAYDLGASSYVLKPSTLAGLCRLADDIDRWWLKQNRVA
jgi:CheY-like chemotaxis protein